MELCQRLHDLFVDKAARSRIAWLSVGLGYTAVTTEDGGIGLSYTYFESKPSCGLSRDYVDWEGRPADGLLSYLTGSKTIHRSMALALVNALNFRFATELPEDPDNRILLDALGIQTGTRVAMVGYIKPLAKRCEILGAKLVVLDAARRIGRPLEFYRQLKREVEVLILTSTSILNHTAEDILDHTADAFASLPVDFLAGSVPLYTEPVLRAVRHGAGTPVIQRYARKVYLKLNRSKW